MHRTAKSWLATVFALTACSDDGPHGNGTNDGDTGGSGETSTESTNATLTDPSSSPTGVDDSSTDAPTSDDSTTGEPAEPPDGEWCSNASTGRRDVGAISGYVPFAHRDDASTVFAGWVTQAGELQVMTYDRESATWADAVTLATGLQLFGLDGPPGAVDGAGNAMIANAYYDGASHLTVPRYDATTSEWITDEFAGPFESLETDELLVSTSGHAAMVLTDIVNGGFDEVTYVYFFDPVSATWSEPLVSEPSDLVLRVAAQDDESGDVMIVERSADAPVLTVRMHDATTGELASEASNIPGDPEELLPLGSGEFVLVTSTGGFQESGTIYGTHFDGTSWQEPEQLGSGFDFGPILAVGRPDGRAAVHWTDAQRGAYARMFDHDDGWTELLVANPTDAQASAGWSGSSAAIDDDGMFMVWSAFSAANDIHTWARRFDGVSPDDAIDLEPMQAVGATRIKGVMSLGVNEARAVWSRGGLRTGTESSAYACHRAGSGWSAPVDVPGYILAVTPMPGGEIMVFGMDDAGAYVEYFAAP